MMPLSDPDAFEAAELDRLSAQERMTLAVLGALALTALGVLAWQRRPVALVVSAVPSDVEGRQRPALLTAAPPQAGWDGALEAARQVDVNAADVAELERLPGVGPALAARIVEERERHGPFHSAEDLTRVRGIGPKTRQALEAYVTTEAGVAPSTQRE